MKLFTTITTLALATFSTVAQTSFTYSVKGELKDNSLDGKMVYLLDNNGSKLDSVLVKGKSFDIKGTANENILCKAFYSRSYNANFILEPGTTTVDLEGRKTLKGGNLTSSMIEVENSLNSINDLMMNKQKELKTKYTDEKELQKAMMAFYNSEMAKIEKDGIELFAKNNNNAVGEYLMYTPYFPQEDLDKQEKLLNSFGSWLKSRSVVMKKMESIASLKNTAEGKQFVDIKGTDANGKAVALSDYVGKGDYVLVDMWASWCGPCKREIPNIAKLYNQYKGKGFNVVGVFVWDKLPNLKKAVEAEKAVWPQVFDSNEVAAKLYGVEGIPNIMLIAPDGKIVKRGLRGEEMIKCVEDLMNKK